MPGHSCAGGSCDERKPGAITFHLSCEQYPCVVNLSNAEPNPTMGLILNRRYLSKSVMNEIVIAGAGGLGREVLQYIGDTFDPADYSVKGFLDDSLAELTSTSPEQRILGSCEAYVLQPNDWVVLAVGDPQK